MTLPTFRRWLGVELIEVSLAEKWAATVGGGLSIFLLMGVTSYLLPGAGSVAVLASMGASAVLLFAMPHGALSQPWPVAGGHLISALVGVVCARSIESDALAASCAVGLSIGAMHQLRCIHPPGGATALTAVLGGTAVQELGYHFLLTPVLVNVLAMLLLATVINVLFPWRRYPAAFSPAPLRTPKTTAPTHDEVVAALRSLDAFVDIREEDLRHLVAVLHHPQPCRLAEKAPLP